MLAVSRIIECNNPLGATILYLQLSPNEPAKAALRALADGQGGNAGTGGYLIYAGVGDDYGGTAGCLEGGRIFQRGMGAVALALTFGWQRKPMTAIGCGRSVLRASLLQIGRAGGE